MIGKQDIIDRAAEWRLRPEIVDCRVEARVPVAPRRWAESQSPSN